MKRMSVGGRVAVLVLMMCAVAAGARAQTVASARGLRVNSRLPVVYLVFDHMGEGQAGA